MKLNFSSPPNSQILLGFDFYDAIKSIYGPQRKNIIPVRYINGATLIEGNHQILERWAEHFGTLLMKGNPTVHNALNELSNIPLSSNWTLPQAFLGYYKSSRFSKTTRAQAESRLRSISMC